MSTKDHDLFDLPTVERDSKPHADGPAQLTVDFSHVPSQYADEFPDKTVTFTNIQISETTSRVISSAYYMPELGSYWEFLIATPKSIGFHIIGPTGTAVVALRHAGSEMHTMDHGTVKLQDYTADESYEVELVNVGQTQADGFIISIAATSGATKAD